MLCALFFTLCGLFGCFYVFMTWNNSYWKKRGIPYKEPEFFFGNFKESFLGRKSFGIVFKEIYKEFPNAPVVGLYVLRDTSILIRDPEIIKNVLVSNFACFMDNDFEIDLTEDKIWGTNPFSNKGEVSKAIRSRWVPHLTQAKLKLSYNSLLKKKKDLVDNLNNELKSNPDRQFGLKNLVSDFFLDYIIHGIFGVEINSFDNADNIFKQVKDRIFEAGFIDSYITHTLMATLWLGNIFSVRFVTKEMEDKLMTAATLIIKLRKETGQPNTDIYDTLQKYSEQDGKETFSVLDLAGRIFGMMLDGAETTANPIGMGLYELACHPEIQDRLRVELNEAVAAGGGDISFEEIHKLPYLEQVCSEILRLYVPLPNFSRLCTKDTTIKCNDKTIEIKKGTAVVVPVYALHTDPQYFPDPYKFDPERFTEEAVKKIPKYVYMPFGEGRRICTGMRLGIVESKVLISTLVHHFHLVSNTQEPRPIPMDPNPNITVYRPAKDCSIGLRPIKY